MTECSDEPTHEDKQLDEREAVDSDLEGGLVFGPHSPRLQPDGGLAVCVPQLGETSDLATNGPVGQPVDPLDAFIVGHSKTKEPALLPLPELPLHQCSPPREAMEEIRTEAVKRSGRLAAKPTAGLSVMQKVQIVLLKKSGVIGEEEPAKAVDLESYRKICKKQLPPSFMDAVTALVEEGQAPKFKTSAGWAVLAA